MTRRTPADVPSLSPKEQAILRLLVAGHRYGLELVKHSDGVLKRGTVYVMLSRMEDKGLVESHPEENPQHIPRIARRFYEVTALGELAPRNAEQEDAFLATRAGVLS